MPISQILTSSLASNLVAPSATTATALSTASGSAPSYSARAWVNFDGTSTVAIRASGNVTSITDNGTGDYTVNFTTALADVNYSVAGCANQDVNGWGTVEVAGVGGITTMTTTALRIRTIGYATYFDPNLVCINIFR
jgi:hypothetical protein